MDGQTTEKKTKHLCVGLLAHVDAGKTTLSEAILYKSGAIRSCGRVDKGDAFLDTYRLEKQRGITIFSKQAEFMLDGMQVTLLDTPGHVDFSAEAERTLQILDYAILVISAADGVQGHTLTLWRLLEKHKIPVFLFINKMDQPGADADSMMLQLEKRLGGGFVRFGKDVEEDAFLDSAAMCSEALMESYLSHGTLTERELKDAIRKRELFPCYFGSALRLTGIEIFLQGLSVYMEAPDYGDAFGARVFKIARDAQGNRLTYLKVTGGRLKVRDIIKGTHRKHVTETESAPEEACADWEEKVTQIRLYSGAKFRTAEEACAGMVCAVTGLSYTEPGMGLGAEASSFRPLLIPVLTYQVVLPDDVDAAAFLPKLRLLEEEEPLLHVVWNERSAQISVQVMGEVQIEILKHLMMERFSVEVSFDEGAILYKETIADSVVGVGHFEPLRHYAEVHLRLEPGEAGSGIVFASACSESMLAKNWQRLILTHLAERTHKGVLTGSPVTDLKMTLIAGAAHPKHTSGGDFRQATYRAVRQGLMEARSILLEPYYSFCLEVPKEHVGRAMVDLECRNAQFQLQQTAADEDGAMAVVTGTAPVATISNYQKEVAAYTSGHGKLSCSYDGYRTCHNTEEVCQAAGYDPDSDLENPSFSIFCAHGAVYPVLWDAVKGHQHVCTDEERRALKQADEVSEAQAAHAQGGVWLSPDEVDKIVAQAGSANQKKQIDRTKRWGQRYTTIGSPKGRAPGAVPAKPQPVREKYLLVDGYNVIFAWEELSALAKENIDAAKGKLADILSNYQAFAGCSLMLVFDAYRVKGHPEEVLPYHNIQIVYTKEAETADQYIERFAHKNSRLYDITVATSDGLEQIIIRSQGCRLLSARDFYGEVAHVSEQIRETYEAYLQKQET